MVASAKKATPKRKLHPLPADPVGARFCNFFNHPWNFILAPVPAAGEKTQWTTENRYPLMPRNLWAMYNDPDRLVGLRFGGETRYALIDIDKDSPYHPDRNLENFRAVLGAAENIGLCRYMLVRSSDSGGLHVYFFLREPVTTFGLACAMKFALVDEGLQLGCGQLEIFPNVKAYSKNKPTNYNAHRLPLQADSYLLDCDCQPVTNNIARFLDWADQDARHQDMEQLLHAIAVAVPRQKATSYNRSALGKAQEWKQHLESRIKQGWTGSAQTNDLLKDIVCYGIVWKHLSSSALINYVVETAINSPGYREYCSHQHQIRQRAAEWVQVTESNQFYTPYCSFPQRLATYSETYGEVTNPGAANNVVPFRNAINEERSAMAMERVKTAIAHLEATNSLPTAATTRANAIAQTTKALFGTTVSKTTLHKPNYLPLWHPKHRVQGCVLDQEKKVSGDSTESEKASVAPSASLIETPEALSLEDSQKNPTPPLYMKVCDALSAPDAYIGHLGAGELEDLNLKQEVFVTRNVTQTTSSVKETDLTQLPQHLEIPTRSKYKENQTNTTTNNAAVDEKDFLHTEQLLSLPDCVKLADVKLNVSDLVAEEPEESIQGQPNPGEDQYSPAPRDVSQVETTSGVDDLKSVSNDVLGEVEKLVGDEYSPQLERLVLNSQTEIVKNALAFVKEKLAKGTEIRQKAGYLTNAIKSKLKPSFPLQPPRGASSQERQYPPGFLEWYREASEKGWVDGRELEDLGWINGRGPIVFVPSLGRAMPWYDAQEAWVDGHPCGEPMEKRT